MSFNFSVTILSVSGVATSGGCTKCVFTSFLRGSSKVFIINKTVYPISFSSYTYRVPQKMNGSEMIPWEAYRNFVCFTLILGTLIYDTKVGLCTTGTSFCPYLSLSKLRLKCLKILAPILGLVGAVGHTVGTQISFLWYLDHPWYHISVFQVAAW